MMYRDLILMLCMSAGYGPACMAVGVVLSILWVFASNDINGYQSVLLAIFTGIVQGILVAGLSNYVNQIIKQFIKEK